jgi:hypothetical protein
LDLSNEFFLFMIRNYANQNRNKDFSPEIFFA